MFYSIWSVLFYFFFDFEIRLSIELKLHSSVLNFRGPSFCGFKEDYTLEHLIIKREYPESIPPPPIHTYIIYEVWIITRATFSLDPLPLIQIKIKLDKVL